MRAYNASDDPVGDLPAARIGPVDPTDPAVRAAVEAGGLHLQAADDVIARIVDGDYELTAQDRADLGPDPDEPDPPADPEPSPLEED